MIFIKKNNTQRKGTFVKNTAIFTGMTFVQKGIAFLLLPLYTSFLTTEQNGVYNLVNSIFALFILLFSFAFDDAVAKRYFELSDDVPRQKKVLGTIVSLALIFSLGGAGLLFLLRSVLVIPFASGISFYPYLLLGLIPVACSSVYAILQKILLIEEKAMSYSLLTILFFILHTVFCIVSVVCLKMEAVGLLLSNALAYIVFFFLSLFFLRKRMVWSLDFGEIKHTVKYCAKLLPNRIASWGSSYLNNIIVGNLVSKAVLGVYSISLSFQNILIILANSLSHAVQPWVYKNIRNNTTTGKEKVFYSVSVLYAFLGFGVSLFSSNVLEWFFKPEFQAAADFIPLLVLGSSFSAISSLLVYYLFYYDDLAIWVSISTCVGVFVDILCSFFLVRFIGAWACAIAAAAAAFARSLVIIIKALKRSGLKLNIVLLFVFPVINYVIAQFTFSLSFWIKMCLCVVEFVVILIYFYKQKVIDILKE